MNAADTVSRRGFLGLGTAVVAGGAATAFLGACAREEPAEGPPPVPRPDLQPVVLDGATATLLFGPSPEEAGVLWGRSLPADYDGEVTREAFRFTGRFGIDAAFRLEGTADVTLPDASTGRLQIEGGQVRVTYGDEALVLEDVAADTVTRGGETMPLARLYDDLRREASAAGVAALSPASRALAIYAAFWHVDDVAANTEAVRAYEASTDDTDYGWWCEAWAKAGAIAIGILGAVGCALLLAGCVGTVVLNGLGVVSCVTANIICGVVGVGLGVLVDVIKELVWAYDDVTA